MVSESRSLQLAACRNAAMAIAKLIINPNASKLYANASEAEQLEIMENWETQYFCYVSECDALPIIYVR